MCVKPSTLTTLKTIINARKIDTSKMIENGKLLRMRAKKYKISEIFTINSRYPKHALKKIIMRNNLINYQCGECAIIDQYNNKSIKLQLDHINGINDDNRIENLRFLCPNCHSQTSTYAGKNAVRMKEYNNCIQCGKLITKYSKRCNDCVNDNKKGKSKISATRDELIELLSKYPLTKIGEMFDVSDNAVRKRCKRLKIEL